MRLSVFIYCLLLLFCLPVFAWPQNPFNVRKGIPRHISPQKQYLQNNITGRENNDKINRLNGHFLDPNFVEIGNAPNAYNFAGNTRSILWADENSNIITLIH